MNEPADNVVNIRLPNFDVMTPSELNAFIAVNIGSTDSIVLRAAAYAALKLLARTFELQNDPLAAGIVHAAKNALWLLIPDNKKW